MEASVKLSSINGPIRMPRVVALQVINIEVGQL